MTEYAVVLIGDENAWEQASDEERAAVMGRHEEFARLLGERGHVITGGAELHSSSQTRQVRRADDGALVVTEGPYVESVEQVGGFYTVRTDDLDDLVEICGVLADGDGAIEVRPVVEYPETT